MLLPLGNTRTLLDYRIVAAYLAGTTSGALLTALLVWVLSGFVAPLPAGARVGMLGVGAVFVWLCKEGPLMGVVALPEARRQIPTEVFGSGLVHGAYRFGFELGTGVRTYAPSPAPYILFLTLLFAQLTLVNTLLVGVGFGIGRALPLLAHSSASERWQLTEAFLRGADHVAPTLSGVLVLIGGIRLV